MKKSRQKNKSFDFKINQTNKLSKILEDPKELDDEDRLDLKDNYNKNSSLHLPSLYDDKSLIYLDFFHEWLIKLKLKGTIYSNFIQDSVNQKILYPLYKRNHRLLSHSNNSLDYPSQMDSNASLLDINSSKGCLRHKETQKILDLEEKIPSNAPRGSVILRGALAGGSRLSMSSKIVSIDKYFPAAFETFKGIVGNSNNIGRDNLRDYLLKKYSSDITEIILKWIFHGISLTFDDWIIDMQKFVSLPDEKHLKMAFEIFDFNKDKFICNNDAFHAITLEENHYLIPDVIKIRNQFILKPRDNTEKPQKFKQTPMGRLKQIAEEKKYKAILALNKPEALSFEDFSKIKFQIGKPHIIRDIISYLIGVNIFENKARVNSRLIERKKSEDIIKEMWSTHEMRELVKNNENYNYYTELESVLSNFEWNQAKILLDKFNSMVCKSYENVRFLSMNSVCSLWPKFFGYDNLYISESFYQVFAGPENQSVNKSRYLTQLQEAFNVIYKQEETSNHFSFNIYDKNKDGGITCDELNEFFKTLPEDTYIYKECLMY